jgi:hypothetical protein
MKRLVGKAIRAIGFDLVRYPPPDASDGDREIIGAVAERTMTSPDRQMALLQAVRYVVRSGIAGCLVECGVWRGGSAMIAALTLLQEGDCNRHLYLYDTFEGMSPPTDVDKTTDETLASTHLRNTPKGTGVWCHASVEDVRAGMESTGYPSDRVHLIQGTVESTIPARAPAAPIAVLRLDTDWYESTKHEMEHLYPLLAEGGVLIIDDYGYWQGAKKAIDEYFVNSGKRIYLHRIDSSGRLLIK